MSERCEKLAVSIADLDRITPELRVPMLAGKLDLTTVIRVGADRKIEDVAAVAFNCDLLTAATVCDLMRSNDRKLGDKPTDLYILRDRAWGRVRHEEVLTVVIDGKVKLNPAMFPDARVIGPAPVAKAIFGRK